ncbi:hypothetical protein QBC38DRAFT_475369 [Podospora fimiseda]|uniref:Uncharacterized protein n=1 Tax=Podospora fimiseda TaxID=252190 RepID=A0AAN7BRX5_9PEZI|nr:hypothetical protein QBC38DRAFT_475369 [Podospora fimiseda]
MGGIYHVFSFFLCPIESYIMSVRVCLIFTFYFAFQCLFKQALVLFAFICGYGSMIWRVNGCYGFILFPNPFLFLFFSPHVYFSTSICYIGGGRIGLENKRREK